LFVAEFLSPRIISLRLQDITIHEFSIATEDPDHFFGTFLSIGFGHVVSVSRAEVRFVRSVCGELWNQEVFEKTVKPGDGKISKDELMARMAFLNGVDGSFECDPGPIASHFYELSVSDFDELSVSVLESILRDPSLLVDDEDSVFDVVHRLASVDPSYFGLLEFVRFEFLSADCMKLAFQFISGCFESFTFGIWSSLRTRLTLFVTPSSQPSRFFVPPIDSKIISAIPPIFSVFGDKTFRLLYRGSRDGFGASHFHSRCNGHPNVITLISTKNNCIFGGYSPLAWQSRNHNTSSADSSLTSFVFTIKNPHNMPARIFKQKQVANAINDYSSSGPAYGNPVDFYVADQCHASTSSYSNLGQVYVNDTGIPGDQVLTGSHYFTVEEIEVFEVI
jgi:hypothetical protein